MKIVELGDYSMIISEIPYISNFEIDTTFDKNVLVINPLDEQISFENTSSTTNFMLSGNNIIAYFSYKVSNKYRINQEIEINVYRF